MDIKRLDAMLIKLFTLKGRTNYTAFEIETWRDVLKGYEEKQLTMAFSNCLKKDGFFEIESVLKELEVNDKVQAMDEWEKCIRVAMDGGRGIDKLSAKTQRSLRVSGGIDKLRFADNEYTKSEMKRSFMTYFDNCPDEKMMIGNDPGFDVFGEIENKRNQQKRIG